MKRLCGIALVVGWMVPGLAGAQLQVAADSIVINEENGLYSVVEDVQVFTDPAGGFDYGYQLTNAPGSEFGIVEFSVPIGSGDPNCPVSSAGTAGAGDVRPSSISVETGQTRWIFSTNPLLLGTGPLLPGDMSVVLTLHSACGPDALPGHSVAGQFGFDAQGDSLGPKVPNPDVQFACQIMSDILDAGEPVCSEFGCLPTATDCLQSCVAAANACAKTAKGISKAALTTQTNRLAAAKSLCKTAPTREDAADCKAAIKTTQKQAKDQAKAFDETAKLFCTLLNLFNRCLDICSGGAESLDCGARSEICMP